MKDNTILPARLQPKMPLYAKQECTHREQTSADPADPDFGLWTPGSEA